MLSETTKKTVAMEQMAPLIAEILNEGRKAQFVMTGNSMMPMLCHRKDVVVLEAVKPEEIKKYDVIFYRRDNGAYILHRVVKTEKDELTLCGDGQYKIEKGVSRSSVIGRLTGFYSHKAPDKFISIKSKGRRIRAAIWVNTRGIRYFFFRVKRRLTQ